MTEGGLAVVLLTYNGVAHLRDQLASIERQTQTPDVLVIADDGSGDGTLELVGAVVKTWSIEVEIVHRPPRLPRAPVYASISQNLQRALDRVSDCWWVALADQDDIWSPDRLESATSVLAGLDPSAPAFTFGDAAEIDASGRSTGRTLFATTGFPQAWNDMSGAAQFARALRQPFAMGATMTMSRRLLEVALPVPCDWLHDRWFSLVGTALGGAYAIHRPVVSYRAHAGQVVGLPEPHGLRWRQVLQRSRSPVAALRKYRALRQKMTALAVDDELLAELTPPTWLFYRSSRHEGSRT